MRIEDNERIVSVTRVIESDDEEDITADEESLVEGELAEDSASEE